MIRVDQRSVWPLAAAIVLISCILYWPNARMGFVLDDHYVVAQNSAIKNPALYPKILTSGFFDAAHRTPQSQLNYYRPLLTASFAVDYRLWGDHAFGYRIVNILLHALNSLLVFALFVLLFGNAPLAALAAVIFCILPTHEWVVRYIVGRGDLLQASFGLLCLIAVVCHLREKKRGWWYLSLLSFVLAMLAREAAVLNIVFVFLVAYYASRDIKRALWTLAPFVILASAYYSLRTQLFPVVQGNAFSGIGEGLAVAGLYVTHFWMPALVSAVVPNAAWITAVLTLCVVSLLVMILVRRDNAINEMTIAGFAVVWIAAGLLPFIVTQRIVERLGPVLSEHFLYFASVGFALLTAFMLEKLSLHARKVLFVGLVTYFLTVGLINGAYWTNEGTLLRHVQLVEQKDFTVAFEQLAMRFGDDEDTVRRLINHSTSVDSRSVWFKRLGNIYHRRKDYPAAAAALGEAVRLNPSNIEAIDELGIVRIESGDYDRGFADLLHAWKMDPDSADTLRLIGTVLYSRGNFEHAIEMFKRSLALDPDQFEASMYLMMAYYFVHDEPAYLDMLERTGGPFSDERAVLRFAAGELFRHGFFSETVKVLAPTQQMFAKDPQTLSLLAEARRRTASLPK
jgi:tetratricopeptide (TPR) repeat protein